jgi:hypothetical protein
VSNGFTGWIDQHQAVAMPIAGGMPLLVDATSVILAGMMRFVLMNHASTRWQAEGVMLKHNLRSCMSR